MQKYKVFLNEKRITFAPPGKITLRKPSVNFDETCTLEGVKAWFGSFAGSDETEAVLTHPDPGQFFRFFGSAFLKIEAAGGVVVQNNRLLFIFRNEKWDLPKGKIDRGESAEEAAVREVEEECGITGPAIVKQLPSTFHIYRSPYKKTKGEWIFKETFWFEMEYKGLEQGIPQTDEGITKVRWFAKKELDEALANTYENLKEIIALYRD